jgi:hypothetical protein
MPGLRIAIVAATFAVGYLCGTLTAVPARAQLGDVMKRAAQSGALGPVGDLGASIIDMQQHVDGLQKNIDTLRKVKTALGG